MRPARRPWIWLNRPVTQMPGIPNYETSSVLKTIDFTEGQPHDLSESGHHPCLHQCLSKTRENVGFEADDPNQTNLTRWLFLGRWGLLKRCEIVQSPARGRVTVSRGWKCTLGICCTMEDALATMNVSPPDDISRSAEEFFPVICPDFSVH
jgi:hypothetical protein